MVLVSLPVDVLHEITALIPAPALLRLYKGESVPKPLLKT
jgi:hypothetical protein